MEALKGLYHVDKLDEKSFIDNFTIRLKEFHHIIDNLQKQKKKPLQHFLITGKRGMGKSTLLRRIHIEASKPPLSDKLFAVRLGTEQYRLSRLFKLWEMVIEQLGNSSAELIEQKQALEKSKHYETGLLPIINDYLKKSDKTLLLLIDNFDQFIDKIPAKDQHAFREALILHPIQVIGNTVFYNEHFKSYNEPFFDFFKPIHLNNLDKEESEEFIRLRAASEGIDNFEEIFRLQRGKINALRILSGGVPRTLLILLSIVSKKNTGDAVDYLHEMIEQVTPLYQDRMKALSSQQQEIMHHLAMHWDRTPVKDLAAEIRIPSKSVSAQLIQLEKSGYIKKFDVSGRNLYYEIDERFFNIWLLMSEAAPYDTKRVIWLTKWLDAFYTPEELKDFAAFCRNELKAIKAGNRFLIAQALGESERLEGQYKRQFVNEMAADLAEVSEARIWANTFNRKLTQEELSLKNEIQSLIDNSNFDAALKALDALEKIDEVSSFSRKGYVYFLKSDIPNAEKYYQKAVEKGDVDAMFGLGFLYDEIKNIEDSEKYYRMAAEGGHTGAMFNLGLLFENEKKDTAGAERYFLMGAENGNAKAMAMLGLLYEDKRNIAGAEKYYLMAVKNGDVNAMIRLGLLYETEKKDIRAAKQYFEMAAAQGDADALICLGVLWQAEKDIVKAEKYYRMAANKENIIAKLYLADLYFDQNSINKKEEALELSNNAPKSEHLTAILQSIWTRILLWNEKIKEARQLTTKLLNIPPDTDYHLAHISATLAYFLVFRQKQFLYQLFSSDTELIDRYKPVYYALMHEIQDEHPKEYFKMPSELEEPVKAILDFVAKEQKRLGV